MQIRWRILLFITFTPNFFTSACSTCSSCICFQQCACFIAKTKLSGTFSHQPHVQLSCWLKSARDTEDGTFLTHRGSILWYINVFFKKLEVHCRKFTVSAGPSAFFGKSQWLLDWNAIVWEHWGPADNLSAYSHHFLPEMNSSSIKFRRPIC